MSDYLYILFPLAVIAITAIIVLWLAARSVGRAPEPYDVVTDGDIADLEIALHLGRKHDPGLTHEEWVASHAPSEKIASMNKALYVGVFAGGEHGDQAIASHVSDIEAARASEENLRALVRDQARVERSRRRWAWLPWKIIKLRRSRIQRLTQEVDDLKRALRSERSARAYLDCANPIDDAPRSRASARQPSRPAYGVQSPMAPAWEADPQLGQPVESLTHGLQGSSLSGDDND